jgi:hypothetical protein
MSMTPELSLDELEELRLNLDRQLKPAIRKRRIKAIKVNSAYRWQPPLFIEVGKECAHLQPEGSPELIVAIFESSTFVVVTPDHGYKKGLPYFFAKEDVQQVIEID